MDDLSYDNIWKSLRITLIVIAVGMFLVRESEEARGIVGFAGVVFGCVLLAVLDQREMRRNAERD
jgi:hypothetical protein